MKNFSSIGSFASHLIKAGVAVAAGARVALGECADLVQKSAIAEFGHLQNQVGPFNAWDELAESTKAEKERQGYWYNDQHNPLIRTFELMNSIQKEVRPFEAIIGSVSPIMAYQEFGTSTIPPRPVLGPALFKNKEHIRAIVGAAVISAFTYGKVVHSSLGYDGEI